MSSLEYNETTEAAHDIHIQTILKKDFHEVESSSFVT